MVFGGSLMFDQLALGFIELLSDDDVGGWWFEKVHEVGHASLLGVGVAKWVLRGAASFCLPEATPRHQL